MATAQNSSSIISSIYKSRKTILELMQKQDYKVEDYNEFSINEVNTMYQNNQLDMLLEKNEENEETHRKKKTYIRYYLSAKLSGSDIQNMIDDLFNLEEILNKNTDTLMIIVKNDMNEPLINLLKHIWEQDQVFVVIQSIKRLQFNILNHVLVPDHRVLATKELDTVKIKYNVTDNTQFPDISRFDPVAQIIGIRPGQVCEIRRPSKTAIVGLYYRICV